MAHHRDPVITDVVRDAAELSLLGSVYNDGRYIPELRQIVSSGDFVERWQGRVWDGLGQLHDELFDETPSSDGDWMSEFSDARLRKLADDKGDGDARGEGADRLLRCVESVVAIQSRPAVAAYAKAIAEKSKLRKLIVAGEKIIAMATGHSDHIPCSDLLAEAESLIYQVNERPPHADVTRTVEDLAADSIAAARQRRDDDDEGRIKTGYPALDSQFVDLREGSLVVIGADSGAGKTSMALNICEYTSKNAVPTLLFSIEMSSSSIADRLVTSHCEMDSTRYRRGLIDGDGDSQLEAARSEIAKSKSRLLIADTPTLTMDLLTSVTRRAVRESGVRLVAIDYLQIMAWPNQKSERESLGLLTGQIKALSRSLNVAVLLLSQLTKVSAEYNAKPPTKADLHGSSSIYKDADAVLLLYRPDMYHDEAWIEKHENQRNLVKVIVDKARNGPRFTFDMMFDPARTRFYE